MVFAELTNILYIFVPGYWYVSALYYPIYYALLRGIRY